MINDISRDPGFSVYSDRHPCSVKPDGQRIVGNIVHKHDAQSGAREHAIDPYRAGKQMKCFCIGQKWIGRYGIYGTFFGEVIEVSDEGQCGVIVITDDYGNEMDTYTGSATEFQSSGEWVLADHDLPPRCADADLLC